MVTSVQARNPGWSDGLTLDAQDIRLVDISALLSGAGGSSTNQLGIGSGVRPGAGNPLQVTVATGLSVSVAPGFAIIQGSTAANAGAYSACLDTAATLTCQSADLANPRLDSVCVTVIDNGDNTSKAVVQVITGNPAPVPSAPSLPADSVLLCNVTVPQNATALTSGDLADEREWAAAAGGIKLVLGSSHYPSSGEGIPGDFYFDMATGRLLVFNGTGLVAPSTVGFAPVVVTSTGVTTSGSTRITVVSATVTTDGTTPVEVSLTWGSIHTSGVPVGEGCSIQLARDGGSTNPVAFGMIKTVQVSGVQMDTGTLMLPDTPPAGTHTYVWSIANVGSTGAFQLVNALMQVKAVSP